MVITAISALDTSDNPGQAGCIIRGDLRKLYDAQSVVPCWNHCEIASGQIHNSKQKEVKNLHIHSVARNFVQQLPRYASTIMCHCSMLPTAAQRVAPVLEIMDRNVCGTFYLHDTLKIRKGMLTVQECSTSAESKECCITQVQEYMAPDEA
jgi:hypothetical protein